MPSGYFGIAAPRRLPRSTFPFFFKMTPGGRVCFMLVGKGRKVLGPHDSYVQVPGLSSSSSSSHPRRSQYWSLWLINACCVLTRAMLTQLHLGPHRSCISFWGLAMSPIPSPPGQSPHWQPPDKLISWDYLLMALMACLFNELRCDFQFLPIAAPCQLSWGCHIKEANCHPRYTSDLLRGSPIGSYLCPGDNSRLKGKHKHYTMLQLVLME